MSVGILLFGLVSVQGTAGVGVCTARAHHAGTSEAEVIFTRQTAPERGRKGVAGGGAPKNCCKDKKKKA